jgi:hypothetical protein
MRRSFLVTTAAFAGVLVLGCADSDPVSPGSALSPAGPNFASQQASDVSREQVTFTLTPADCPVLTTTVTGTGIFHAVAHISFNAQETKANFSFHDSFVGTATGADGSRYRFSYNNHYNDTNEPVAPFEVRIVDNFHLLGQGGAPNIGVQQRHHFRVNADGTITDLGSEFRGDPVSCDPL